MRKAPPDSISPRRSVKVDVKVRSRCDRTYYFQISAVYYFSVSHWLYFGRRQGFFELGCVELTKLVVTPSSIRRAPSGPAMTFVDAENVRLTFLSWMTTR
jgi:hypothetical protein